MSRAEKIERLAHANALIKVISDHGRRFFWNERDQRVASLEMDERGKIWWVDDHRGARVYTHKTTITSRWQGFSHGGTLRSLVEYMRDYVVHGRQIPRWQIATPRLSGDDNIWGYSQEAAKAVREAAFVLPIMQGGES